ncbi:cardiolipin synthase [Gaoshiqia sp. Z1-71]|uniref:cardiolipin synthase n=1 Tax=Gaoshiqia hydrogeniformans TaxID=3290090 RepID=UPI003BF91663
MPVVLNLVYLLTVIFIAILIVLENRSPLKTISWILVLVLLPFAGIIFYLFFGQEYRKKKMFSRKGLKDLENLRKMTQSQLDQLPKNYEIFSEAIFGKKHLINLMLSNSNALLTDDNEVTVLKNGEQTFPALFQAIEEAHHHIHIEFYIVEDDMIGNQFRELLIRKAREGVEVRFIFDDVGSWELPKKYIRSLEEAGVKIDCFMKVRFPMLTSRANYRDHRKIVVVDGTTAFVGGLNIADRYLHGTRKLGHWRDTHLMLKGGAATGLQIIFMADWFFVSKEILQGEHYFHPIKPGKGKMVQIVHSGPDSDWETISQAYFSAIASARERVYMATPYLIPTPEIANAMKVAALGGIDIRVLLPQKSDAITPKWSTHSYIAELLEAGVKIYFYQPGFMHSKLIIVDGVFSSVGTANFDFRSLETNFEVNAMIYDELTAGVLEKQFLNDLKQSREILLPDWKKRHWSDKAKESFSRLLSPLL